MAAQHRTGEAYQAVSTTISAPSIAAVFTPDTRETAIVAVDGETA